MTNIAKIRRLIQAFNFDGLFEELGWDRFKKALTVSVDDFQYDLTSVRQKRGFQVYHYLVPDGDEFPKAAVMAKIQREVAKTAHENLVIFSDQGQTRQCFRIAKREEGKLLRSTGLDFHKNHSGEALAQRLSRIAIGLDEEDDLTLVDVANRASELYAERVTRSFFAQFKTQRDTFKDFISGIQDVQQQEWYASLMLNRLMFVYFVQKKGFLDRDLDYLKNRLNQSRQADKDFHSFYQYFLLRLFHDGLNKRPDDRDPELEKLLGEVPYLNGGIFGEHEIEQLHNDIEIPDEAFENLFEFFDDYQWHLDDRELRSDREINPDVLGYIFEKYINQKQMGAYYTKEDITEYISKNTILPYLFDEAARRNNEPFHPDREVWTLLRDDPDRYIYDAVGHGIFVNVHTGQELDKPAVLPANIAAGISDVTKRADWNTAAPPEVALPTETWREHIARRERCVDLRAKLKAGEVTSINDLVTLNLNIRQFAQDVIDNCESADLLRAIYYTIAGRPEQTGSNHKAQLPLSVLDPTCGSGAFLFAAVNILQPLYEACLTKMQQFVTDADNAAPVTVDDEVAALIELGESDRIEFKSTARWDVKTAESLAHMPEGKRLEILKQKDKERQQDILKAAAALLNTKGGDLLIGVTDEGVGYGVRHDYAFFTSKNKQNRDHYELWLMGLFKDQFGKTAAGCIEPVFAKRDGEDVVWLKISPSPDPAMFKKDGSDVFYRRIGNSSESLGMNEYATYRQQWFAGEPPPRIEPKLKLTKTTKKPGKKLKDFREILSDVDKHLNRTYFVLKSIIINNLYGVDIMPEAVEICKLRLFLKLMSTVDPQYSKDNLGVEALPDIDFNIRAGNTLVGYTTLEEIEKSLAGTLGYEQSQVTGIRDQTKIVSLRFQLFRDQQTQHGGEVTEQNKAELRNELRELTSRLDEFLAGDYGIDPTKLKNFSDWKESHQPFHWFAEFYAIYNSGGFSVVIGNPPYVEYSTVKDTYRLQNYATLACGNLYAMTWERCLRLVNTGARTGLIVPVASICTDGYRPLQQLLSDKGDIVASSYNDRPSKLFDGLEHIRLSIILHHTTSEPRICFATRYNKWNAVERDFLFQGLSFCNTTTLNLDGAYAKISDPIEEQILARYLAEKKTIGDYCGQGNYPLYYTRKLSHFVQILDFIPRILDADGNAREPSELKSVWFREEFHRDAYLCLLNSSLFYWLITTFSDCRNLNKREIFSARLSLEDLTEEQRFDLVRLSRELMKDIEGNSEMKAMNYKKHGLLNIQCTFPKLSKPVIDEIDDVLASHFKFKEEEVDFVKNFDAKYRLSLGD